MVEEELLLLLRRVKPLPIMPTQYCVFRSIVRVCPSTAVKSSVKRPIALIPLVQAVCPLRVPSAANKPKRIAP